MRKWIAAAALACGLGLFAAVGIAAEDRKEEKSSAGKTFSGILIDNKCGDSIKSAKAAQRHPPGCIKKDVCAKSGYQVIVGDQHLQHLKFDEKGNTLAKEYLDGDEYSTRVVVTGTAADDGKTIKVTSIKAAPEEKEEKEKDAKEKDAAKESTEKADKGAKAKKGEPAPKSEK